MQICDKCKSRVADLYITPEGYMCLSCCVEDPDLVERYPALPEMLRRQEQAKLNFSKGVNDAA